MLKLPLYNLPALSVVERTEPRELDPNCRLCSLGARQGLRHVCIPPAGAPGGLLIVGEGPGEYEDREGRPFVGQTGQYLREIIRRSYKGPIAYDNATRCWPRREDKATLLEKAADACRGYLRKTLDEVKPTRIIALGGWAYYGLLGRSIAPFSTRRGYGWLWNNGQHIPVFAVIHPAAALRNPRFVGEWFASDMTWAITSPLPELPPFAGAAYVVSDVADAMQAFDALQAAPWLAFDVETFGRMYSSEFRLLSVAVSTPEGVDAYVWSAEALADEVTCNRLRSILSVKPLVAQNKKFDGQALRRALKMDTPRLHLDTRLVRKLLEPEADAHLDSQAELVGMGGHKDENTVHKKLARGALRKWGGSFSTDPITSAEEFLDEALTRKAKKLGLIKEETSHVSQAAWFTESVRDLVQKFDSDELDAWAYGLVPRNVLYRYNALDTVVTARLARRFEACLIDEPEAKQVWSKMVRPASRTIEHVEATGIGADKGAIALYGVYLGIRIGELRQKFGAFGPDFNPDSPRQVGDLLFKTLGLNPPFRTKTGQPSTDKDSLQALKGQDPIVEDLLEYRRLTKQKNTYSDGLIVHVQDDGRIHSSLNIDGARSGRLSSSSPNLQNQSRASTAEGKMLKDCFVPAKGCLFVEADFSQLELRVAALLSGDTVMRELFSSGADFHLETAKFIAPIVWKIKPEEVKDEHRSKTKAFVFGIIYGMSDDGIVSRTGCSLDEAMMIRRAVMGRFRLLDKWIDEQKRRAFSEGGCWTWWMGQKFRWRPLWRLGDQDGLARSEAENASYNTPVQGTANEFCLASLVALDRWLEDTGFPAKIVMTVHDSILVEVLPEKTELLISRMRKIMTGWDSGGVPMAVDFKVGPTWGALSKYEPKAADVVSQGAV